MAALQIVSLSSTRAGRPLLEIEAAPPLDALGKPELDDELAALIRPHLNGADNINVRFASSGAPPATMLAVIAEMTIPDDDIGYVYAIRSMVYDAPRGRVECNVQARLVRRDVMRFHDGSAVSQLVERGDWYAFVDTYDTLEQSRDGLTNFVGGLHDEIRRWERERAPWAAPSRKPNRAGALGKAVRRWFGR